MAISKTLVATAVSGLVFGALSVGCASAPATPDAKAPDPAGAAKACCKGHNECKGKGGCNGHCPKT